MTAQQVVISSDERVLSIEQRRQSVLARSKGKHLQYVEIAFTLCLLAVTGKLAHANATRADLEAKKDQLHQDILVFNHLFVMDDNDRASLDIYYIDAICDRGTIEHYAKQLVTLVQKNYELFETLIQQLYHFLDIAGYLNDRNFRLLCKIAQIMGCNEARTRAVIYQLLVPSGQTPFEILKVQPSVSYVDLKRAYRQAIKDCHPDAVLAKGIKDELAQLLRSQYEAYQQAYEEIKKKRGF